MSFLVAAYATVGVAFLGYSLHLQRRRARLRAARQAGGKPPIGAS